jgi:positive regulator of sigma E activity
MSANLKSSLFQEMLDICIQQMQKEENKQKISTYIIEPSFTFIFERLYPYILLTAIIFILLLLLFIVLIFILIRNHQSHHKF